MLTNPFVIHFRAFTRKLGINSFLGALLFNEKYEDKFSNAFQSAIQPGDIIWDIGANVGLYTKIFADVTGPLGRVVAFEPTLACYYELEKRFNGNPRVILKNIALGDSDGVLSMAIEEDALAATHRVVKDNPQGSNLITVVVSKASTLVAREPDLFPQIIKIDVEGHEGAVMDGLALLLTDLRLRCIGIEVHFGILHDRGEGHRPKQIEKILIEHGFHVRWTDASHLLAVR